MFRPFWTVKNIVAKKNQQKTPLSEFFLLFESGRPRPLFLSARRGWRGGGTIIFSFIRGLAPFWVQNFEFQYLWGFSEKWIFFGVWRFCGYLLGSSQNTKKLTPKMVQAYVCLKISEYPPPPPPFSPRCEYAWNSWTISADVIFCVWGHYTDSKDTLIGPTLVVGGNVGVAAYQPCTNIEPTQQCRPFSHY